MIVERTLSPEFAAVKQLFASHFERDDEFQELGAALAVYRHGKKVVDLYGGYQDPDRLHPWTERSIVNIWSASKGVMAVAIAQLVDQGLLDYNAPVAIWWPEFGQAGKQGITLNQILSHSSGLNGFAALTSTEDLFHWDRITQRLAAQAPLWQPGSAASYHGMTFGWLTGELIRRVTGNTPREYIHSAIAAPLELDLSLGVYLDRIQDVAEIVPPQPDKNPITLNEIAHYAASNPIPDAANANRREWRNAEIPAVNIHATADSVARIYAALANDGMLESITLLSPNAIDEMRRPRGGCYDEMLGERQWAAGMALNTTGIYGPNPQAFGHSGWGGSFACADPENGIGIAYVVNRMGSALNGDPRARAIVKAVYDSIK
ncbi:serine hydrolase domain-containing protein [Microbulbifer pacificus]|uniref:Serine hydrolase domain-containing protein n=1 Tax=Microbulbifer pacificus TaxID=407164 RepID=A0AAU0N2L0_9GAMM|nr:serine hydrolase domain-containing protein [Microbulbifer pacificus]WOX07046.1 serine hydrolase domain-containing protein [Microbulbifer pacificus]